MYGDKRDYRKIDIYVKGHYEGTTTWSRTLKEAKEKYIEKYEIESKTVKCVYQ